MKSKVIFAAFIILNIFSGCYDDSVNGSKYPVSSITRYDFSPVWFPDGHAIAYYHYDVGGDSSGTYLIDTSGNNKLLLINNEHKRVSDVSNDGNWLLIYDSEIYKMRSNGDSLIQLTFATYSSKAVFSPDGNWIVYISGLGTYQYSGIWIMKPDGTMQKQIGNADYALWLNNNENLLTVYDERYIRKISVSDTNYNIMILDLNQVIPQFPYTYHICTSPDDLTIYFSACYYEVINYQIFSVNINGSNLNQLTVNQGTDLSLSPDGEQIVYCDPSQLNGYLWIMNKDGTNKRQLTFP